MTDPTRLAHPRDGVAEADMDDIAAMSHEELVQWAWRMQDSYDRLVRRVEDLIDDPRSRLFWSRVKHEAGYFG